MKLKIIKRIDCKIIENLSIFEITLVFKSSTTEFDWEINKNTGTK